MLSNMKKQNKTSPKPAPHAHFLYTNPNAKAVFVAGTFTNWAPTPMTAKAVGVWSRDLPLAPGNHEYCFVVDGTWIPDPAAANFKPNPFGGKNSVLTV
jgi:1,4-alpha-glucan branching enzyme